MPTSPATDLVVLKLGGSTLDLPDLRARLEAVVQHIPSRLLLVVGGGGAADCVRAFDAVHRLGEEAAHHMAIQAMDLNAHMLAAVLPDWTLAPTAGSAEALWRDANQSNPPTAGQAGGDEGRRTRRKLIVHPTPWIHDAERTFEPMPHHWDFTSDSVAAYIARQCHASRLILLKSAGPSTTTPNPPSPPTPPNLATAAAIGLVDPCFPEQAKNIPAIEFLNLRDDKAINAK